MKKGDDNMRKTNKGFSLVELIIVIAIMAILVGLMVPLLIIYIEKTNVSSDYQLADTIYNAMLCASTDAKVVDDPASQPYLANMESGPIDITTIGTSVLKDSLEDILGVPTSAIVSEVKSRHGSGCQILVSSTNGIISVVITETDNSGKGDTSSSTTANDIRVN